MDFNSLYDFVISKLDSELPDHITYHNTEHTKYVLESAILIARKEGVGGNDLVLLKTAALLHDVGFTISHKEHEALSCDIAQKILPDYNYLPDQIDHICEMIMATKLPQKPRDKLAKILCDADLYYLGGNSYDAYASRLYNEFKANQIVKNEKEWLALQIDFLKSHQFFTQTARNNRNKNKRKTLKVLRKEAKGQIKGNQIQSIKDNIIDFFLMVIGVSITAFALQGFLVPNKFFDGGISGISLLISQIFDIDLSIIIVLLNLPLIIISNYTVGRKFAIRTFISIALLSVALWYMPDITVTNDKLLIAVFGGIFLGLGIGLAMRGGTALDGIDVLALYTFKKTSFSMTEIILALNIVIFAIAGLKFGIESAFYSILTYFAATISLGYVVDGLQAQTGVTIISNQSEEIKYKLVNELERGITVYKGERGFLPGQYEVSSECDIIFTVIRRLEMRKLKILVYSVDPNAFVFASTIKEATGGVLRKKAGY
ncbi:YitT family protein [Portibacter marinus]|uniref:YitT family protein n=1 Tax=Portibacter marinus TaxID=2898660 RepID=UPI001F3F3DF1|nr:YitT family protein [Portibacter marinus]